jgi:predicted Rdx family selenoprotein
LAETIVSGLRGTVGHGHPVEMVELVPSGGGVFDVSVDGDLVFSKHKEHRHAEAGEILEMLRKRVVL